MCLKFQNGDVVSMSELPRLAVSKPTQGMLNELTSSELSGIINKLNLVGVPKSAKKSQIISAILRSWERVVMSSASSSATTLEREEERQRKRDEAYRKRWGKNPPTTVVFNSSGNLESVNETRYDKDTKDVEPEPEEPEPITWSSNDETVLQFLTTLNENSGGIFINYDQLEMLRDKKKRYEEEQKRLSSQTASASAGYVETSKEEASDDEWANCSLQDMMSFADEDDIINKDEYFPSSACVKTIWLVRSLDKKDGVAVRMN